MIKRILLLIISSALILSAFAGCANNTGSAQNTAAATTSTVSGGTNTATAQTAEPTEEPEAASPYNFAPGKYELNDRGFPAEPYEYELPISSSGETLSFWTVCHSPQYIPEGGYGDLPNAIEQMELTGVNIEYYIVSSTNARENYTVMAAADDLLDVMAGAVAHTTDTIDQNIENEFWVNIYDYKEYCPNYIYQVTKDPSDDEIYYRVFYRDNLIAAFYCVQQSAFIGTNFMTRGDW